MMLMKQATAPTYQNQESQYSGYNSPSSDDQMSTKERVSESDYSDAEPETPTINEEEEEYSASYSKAVASVRMTKKRPAPQTVSTSVPKTKSGSLKKKNKVCEFCGTNDTPMWRRGPQGKGTLCNACGVKWSLKYRKKNGKEVTTSVSTKPMKNKGFRKEKDDDEENRDPKRRRAFDSNDENSLDGISSGDDVTPGSQLFGSLLNEVENKLVETQEVEALKAELYNFKVAAHIKNEQHQRFVEQLQTNMMLEMQDFRRQFTSVLAATETLFHNKLERAERETREAHRRTDMISRDLDELRSLLKLQLVGDFASKIEGLEYQVSEVRSNLESKCQELREQVHKEVFILHQ